MSFLLAPILPPRNHCGAPATAGTFRNYGSTAMTSLSTLAGRFGLSLIFILSGFAKAGAL